MLQNFISDKSERHVLWWKAEWSQFAVYDNGFSHVVVWAIEHLGSILQRLWRKRNDRPNSWRYNIRLVPFLWLYSWHYIPHDLFTNPLIDIFLFRFYIFLAAIWWPTINDDVFKIAEWLRKYWRNCSFQTLPDYYSWLLWLRLSFHYSYKSKLECL